MSYEKDIPIAPEASVSLATLAYFNVKSRKKYLLFFFLFFFPFLPLPLLVVGELGSRPAAPPQPKSHPPGRQNPHLQAAPNQTSNLCYFFQRSGPDRLHAGHIFKHAGRRSRRGTAEKQIPLTSAGFKRQSDGSYLDRRDAALHTTQEKGPKELSVVPFMFAFLQASRRIHSLCFCAERSKHGSLQARERSCHSRLPLT